MRQRDPEPDGAQQCWNHLGRAYFVARRYAEAIDAFGHISRPDHTHHAFLAAAHARLGDADTAAAHAREVIRLQPAFAVEAYLDTLHYEQASDREHHRESLLAAGLPA